jgi:hypothetical protein
MTGNFGDGTFLNKKILEAGGKRGAGGDDRKTNFFMGPYKDYEKHCFFCCV